MTEVAVARPQTPHVHLCEGCPPEPLASYLKGLGIHRLIYEQADATARSAWSPRGFVLHTSLSYEELITFFLDKYEPTPLLAPWNGGSGFWRGPAAQRALQAIEASTSPRFERYRQAIRCARDILARMGIQEAPQGRSKQKEKLRLLRALRSWMPDEYIRWLDALSALTEGEASYAPLLGSGGNDGNLEFSVNFMQRLADAIPLDQPSWPGPAPESGGRGRGKRGPRGAKRDPRAASRGWLEAALFQKPSPPLARAAVGQFHPGGVGGPNATQGFEGRSLVNPWDFVFMMEGTLVLAGSVARRMGSRQGSAFPFTVGPSPVGWQTLADADAKNSRAELWLPLWNRPATFPEIAHLMAEGRAQLQQSGRPARTGVDFARSIASLGVDRGLTGFFRYGFYQRSGRSYVASPLGRIAVRDRIHRHIGLLDQADPWLDRLRRLAATDDAPARLRAALRTIDEAMFAYALRGSTDALQQVLTALGQAEQYVARSPKAQERGIPPLQLGPGWRWACDDGTFHFRIARAVASIQGVEPPGRQGRGVASMRAYMEPVQRSGQVPGPSQSQWQWHPVSRSAVWGPGDLVRNLIRLLERRCVDALQAGIRFAPLPCPYPLSLADVRCFLAATPADDERIAGLIEGLSLLSWPPSGRPGPVATGGSGGHTPDIGGGEEEQQDPDNTEAPDGAKPQGVTRHGQAGHYAIDRLYALLKLMFHHHPHDAASRKSDVPHPGAAPAVPFQLEVLSRLRSGGPQDIAAVTRTAFRSLVARGLKPIGHRRAPAFLIEPAFAHRLAASLLLPVRDAGVVALKSLVVQETELTGS